MALTQEWAPSAVAQPAAPQQFVFVRTGWDTHRSLYAQPSKDRSVKGTSRVEEGEQTAEGDQYLHNKKGKGLVGSFPVVSHVPCSVVHMSTSQLQPLLGAMASLLDHIASQHVFGAIGTVGRPRGYITLYTICTMDDDKILDKSQHRWMQFLQIWKSEGWGCSDVVLLTEELRRLQYGQPQILAQIARVDAKMMLGCISRYGNSQWHRRFKLKDSLIRFLNVLQQNFSSPKTVLLCDPSVYARLRDVQVMDNSMC